MLTIHKYPFSTVDEFDLTMPEGAVILKIEAQGMHPCLWAMVDTDQKPKRRHFRVFGTGHPIDPEASLEHVATFQQPPFVWHVFEATA